MISPEDIRQRARRLWASGEVLRGWLSGGGLFPYAVPFGKPSAREWLDRFAELRREIEALEASSKAKLGAGYSIAFKEVSHQKLGRLRVPERITFGSAEDAAACAGERAALAQFREVAATLRAAEPSLADWLAEHPLVALEHAAVLPHDDLRDDRLGVGVRLEQERIEFGRVQAAINAISSATAVFPRLPCGRGSG